MDSSVRERTNALLYRFTYDILTQVEHLDIIFETSNTVIREEHVTLAKSIAQILDFDESHLTTEYLKSLAEILGLVEINIASKEGFVTHSNYVEYIGFDYSSNDRTKPYLALTDGTLTEFQERPRRSVSDDVTINLLCHYTGIALDNGGFLQIGFDASALLLLQDEINIEKIITDARVGDSGYGMVFLAGRVYAHPDLNFLGQRLFTEDWFSEVRNGNGFTWITLNDNNYYAGFRNSGSYTVIGLIPEAEYFYELNQMRDNTILFVSLATAIMIVVILAVIQVLLKPIKVLTEGIDEIGEGNFDARIEGKFNDEFKLIKDAVNHMAESVKTYLNDKIRAEQVAYEAKLHEIDLKVQVYNDSLTGIYNRRYLDENLDRVVKSLSRSNSVLSVLMLDIDCFKLYNDTYGHKEGDECLRAVAIVLKEIISRQEDFVLRYGGEEFCIVLPYTDEEGANQVAESILKSIRDMKMKHEGSFVTDYLTLSIGGTTGSPIHTQNGEEFIKRADEALYKSKENGRDRFTSLPMIGFEDAEEEMEENPEE